LGCYGDGGVVFAQNESFASKIKMLLVHGQNQRYHHRHVGIGGRLDTLHAAVLLKKYSFYEQEISLRQSVAESYTSPLTSSGDVRLPMIRNDRASVWVQYTIRSKSREEIQGMLKEAEIPSAVRYPMPLHLHECFQYLENPLGSFPVSEFASREVISLPMNPYIEEDESQYVAKALS